MTALCGGGTSASKPGFNEVVVVSAAGVEAFLVLIGFPEVAAALGPLLAGTAYHLTTFCAIDPPADPGLTNQDLIDILNFLDPAVGIPALAKFQQWFDSQYWHQVCQCVSGSTPVRPAPSSPGTPTTNAGIPGSTSAPCFAGEVADTINSSATQQTNDLGPALLPISLPAVTTHTVIGTRGNVAAQAYPIPAGVQSLQFAFSVLAYDPALPQSAAYAVNFYTCDAAGNFLSSFNLTGTAAGVAPGSDNLVRGGSAQFPSTATHYGISSTYFHAATATSVPQTVDLKTTVQCAGPPLSPGCCPPDPLVTNKLDQIYGLLSALYQGSAAPIRSFASATVHAGLTGSGNFPIGVGVLAIRVDVTTVPSFVGQVAGDPVQLFDVGVVTTSAAEGAYRSHTIEHNPQLYILGELVDTVHFTLKPGVVVTITELTRGP